MKRSASRSLEPTEHEIQSALVDWCALNGVPIFAIPNGGFRHIGTARKLQREGVKPGIPDLFVPICRVGKGGLFIEMKTKKGRIRPDQAFWIAELSHQYQVVVCRSLDEGIASIRTYLDAMQ